MLEIQSLSKSYADIKALDNLNITIKEGDIVGFLGPNGAGKSTCMKIICGIMPASSGKVLVDNKDIGESPIEVKSKIGYLPEHPPLYLDMRVAEYLKYVAQLKQIADQDIDVFVEDALKACHLLEVKNRIISQLSKGFRQRIGIAQAIIAKPPILILDEPTVGLDPQQMHEVRSLIKSLSKNHIIVLSTHILSEVEAICNRIIIINKGKLLLQDSIHNWQKKSIIRSVVDLEIQDESVNLEFINTNPIIQQFKIENINKEQKTLSLRIELKQDTTDYNQLLSFLILNGVKILSLKTESNSIENLFLQLIENGNEK